jgi:hypothetical protein
MKCPSCGASNTDEFQHCQRCGSYISPLYEDQGGGTPAMNLNRQAVGRGDLDPKRITESLRTLEPVIGGAIVILASIGAAIVAGLVYSTSMEWGDTYAMVPISFIEQVLKITMVTSAAGIVGGAAAVVRRQYAFANVGCIAALMSGFLIFFGFALAALIAWGLIASSKEEFKPVFPRNDLQPSCDATTSDQ